MESKNQATDSKGFLEKLNNKEEDSEDRLAIVSTFVRLGILIWSGGILTLAYIKLPPALGIPEQKLDPTFIASVFTGVLATFGVQTAKKSSNSNSESSGGLSKAEIQKLIEAAAQNTPKEAPKFEQDSDRAKDGEPPVVPPTS
jgi:hypothetical protein